MCLICDRIKLIKEGKNPYFVEEKETGYVVMEDNQKRQGYTIFLCKKHAFELHELDSKFRAKFLEEMAEVAKDVWDKYKPEKLNYELLGNQEPHLHWHIIPRYKDDPVKNLPIWVERNYAK